VHLVRDCLDKQLLDRRRRRIGRVDGIVVRTEARRRPRVVFVEVGARTRARRLPGCLARWMAAWTDAPDRLPFGRVQVERIEVIADVDADARSLFRWERRVRDWLSWIPGA
jgi:hypothetical protein